MSEKMVRGQSGVLGPLLAVSEKPEITQWHKAASTAVQSIFDRTCRHSPAQGCPRDESAAPLGPRLAVARRSPPNAPRCAINCVIPNGRSSAQRAPPRGYASSSEHTLKGLASAHAPSTGARRSAVVGASAVPARRCASAAAWIIQVKILHCIFDTVYG